MPRLAQRQPSFADLELEAQGGSLDGTLQRISDFLEKHGALVEMVRQELERGLKNHRTGRDGINAERVLRSFLLKGVKSWDLRELRERIADGLGLRQFTRFFSDHVPKHDAFARAFNRLTPETIQALNHAVVVAAVSAGLERPEKLRVDTTVVETNIHFPSDSTLLWDCVRVLTRLALRLKKLLPKAVGRFRNRTRSARRRMQRIQRLTPKQRIDQNKPLYADLIGITQQVVQTTQAACEKVVVIEGLDVVSGALRDGLVAEITHYTKLAHRVIDQARRRVLRGEEVLNAEKIFSIFQTHTDLIKRGKAQRPVEFGHKVFLAESRAGLITEYHVLDGNPIDEGHVVPSLENHKKSFGQPPLLYAADRGFYSTASIEACRQAGVGVECIPQKGGQKTPERSAYEKSPAFKKGQRFRAGIEGRISVLLRGRGMRRCLTNGRQRFDVFVGLAVLANNLMAIANLLTKPRPRRRLAA
jgi:IS5 family transposase